MKITITGANGLFGHGLVQVFQETHEVVPMTRAQADLTRVDEVRRSLHLVRPDALVHAAAAPDPDVCEMNLGYAFLNNVVATQNVVQVAEELGIPVAHISTDAVFDGSAD